MKVTLVSLTKSEVVTPEGSLTPEQLIVYAARVSNPSNQMNHETSDKLIAYLIKNKHWSPFEMADMGIEIVTSRAIAAQILRHWSFSFQEFSQRYAEVLDMEPVQLRKQAVKNRQSSEEVFDPYIDLDENGNIELASEIISKSIAYSEKLYKALIKAGAAKECARMILPLTTQTKIYMKSNIRDWIFYLKIRTDEHVQLEHREIALEIKKIFMENFPNISKALDI